ncbi:histone-binding protein N1/N2-like isoform X3 [Homarus americanus]|uniref:histone-binding protein N1/N2-like isoform X3 n=1 Tax=Homarus americanus TaxID=6706 RepID=UPI001C48DC0D|nr:histone-binding protein N1/N2-like isoform X3 [Homarus americanus]
MSESLQKTGGTSSPKSSPSKKEIDAATAALNHFAQGKRHLVVGDIPSAVNSLQEACRFLAEKYGETAPECGDAYFHYGRALLELARIESGVLGNALDGVPDEEDMDNSQVESSEKATEEEWVKVSKDVGGALEENYSKLEEKRIVKEMVKKEVGEGKVKESGKEGSVDPEDEKKENAEQKEIDLKGNKDGKEKLKTEDEDQESKMETEDVKDGGVNGKLTEDGKLKKDQQNENGKEEPTKNNKEGSTEDEEEEEDDDDDDDEEEEEGDGESQEGESQDEEGNKDEAKSQEEGEGEKTEEEEEEVSNLQLSWEMLELAKVIFQKQEESNPEMTKKVAQVYLKLGEVGLESENYVQGIEDFTQCLKIQEKSLEEDNRCIAETHYQLGVAHSFSDDFDKAVESFQAALKVIELRIDNLKKKKKEKEGWTEEQRTKDAVERPDPFYTEQGEIDELNKLLPEIKEKVIDMEEMKKDSKEKLQKTAKAVLMAQAIGGRTPGPDGAGSSQTGFGFDAPSSSSSKMEAKPIAHLVRKKQRKPEEEAKVEIKKAKVENGEAVATTNGTKSTNGQPDSMETEDEKKESPSKSRPVEDIKKKAAEDMKKATDEITKEQPQSAS